MLQGSTFNLLTHLLTFIYFKSDKLGRNDTRLMGSAGKCGLFAMLIGWGVFKPEAS